MPRRDAIKTIATGAVAVAAGSASAAAEAATSPKLKGNIRHSVCKWPYKKHSLEELCVEAKRIGIESIDLVAIEEMPILRKHGLMSAMIWGVPGGIVKGLNRLEHHDEIVEFFETNIPAVGKEGLPNVITFSGNRNGMDDEQGLENCAVGLKRLMPLAEKHGVTVTMELLNSKRSHKDYMCDYTKWGVALCEAVGSERFKLLYDIFHMQIMEGDVIDTIREFHPYIGHYHTGGVPGRNEIDDTQELYYPAIMRAIAETGFKGHVAQEFVPANDDNIASLEKSIEICDI